MYSLKEKIILSVFMFPFFLFAISGMTILYSELFFVPLKIEIFFYDAFEMTVFGVLSEIIVFGTIGLILKIWVGEK